MLYARVLALFIHIALMYATNHIFPGLPIKDIIRKDLKRTTSFKLSTGTKTLVTYLGILFIPLAV